MLAQINESEIPEDQRAPGNSNPDNTHVDPETNPQPTLGSHDIDAKIDVETDANLAGLAAKEEFILKKLRWYRDNAVQTLCDMDEQCREKVLLEKEKSKDALDAALSTATAQAKQCRVDFVEATLTAKEQVKGDLEELLNHAIQAIKELKVAEIFTESGIPGGDHTTVVEDEIATILSGFNTQSNILYNDFSGALLSDANDFKFADTNSGSCLDDIKEEFDKVYDNDVPDHDERGLK